MIRVLPSLFTLGNLLCGFAAIFLAFRFPGRDELLAAKGGHFVSSLEIAASLVFVGMVFDALDGRVARLTRQTSQLGEQLDSMADMLTFGAAPAFLVIQLVNIGTPFFDEAHGRWDRMTERFVLVVGAVYVACTALRLARFNAEIEQPGESDHMTFKGLPSPAAAGTICSLALLHQQFIGHQNGVTGLTFFSDGAKLTAVGMVFITLLAAVAMVSTLRYSHIANRYLRDRAPIHYVGAAVIIILIPLLTWPQVTLSVIFVGYALSAPLLLLLQRSSGGGRSSGNGTRVHTETQSAVEPHRPEAPTLRLKRH